MNIFYHIYSTIVCSIWTSASSDCGVQYVVCYKEKEETVTIQRRVIFFLFVQFPPPPPLFSSSRLLF